MTKGNGISFLFVMPDLIRHPAVQNAYNPKWIPDQIRHDKTNSCILSQTDAGLCRNAARVSLHAMPTAEYRGRKFGKQRVRNLFYAKKQFTCIGGEIEGKIAEKMGLHE